MVRQNRMTGTGKIISFINRDELAHTKFISELIRAIIGENPELQTNELTAYVHQAFEHAIELETQWSSEVLDGIDGIDVEGNDALCERTGPTRWPACSVSSACTATPPTT